MKKFKKFWTKRNTVLVLVGAFILINLIQIHRALGTFGALEGTSSSLISEVGEVKGFYQEMGSDLAEVRELLRLPVGGYVSGGLVNDEEHEADSNGNKLEVAIFEYIDFLADQKMLQADIDKARGYIDGLRASGSFQKFLTDGGLVASEAGDFEGKYSFNVAEGENVFVSYVLDTATGDFERISPLKVQQLAPKSLKDFENGEVKFVRENATKLRGHFKKLNEQREVLNRLLGGEDLAALKAELAITIDENGLVMNKLGEPIGEIKLDTQSGNFDLVDLKNGDNSKEVASLPKSIAGFLRSLETQSFLERKFSEAVVSVEKTMKDKGFKLLLSESGLKISEKREDEDRVYYDIVVVKSGAVLGSIVIERATGVVNVTDPNGANSENVLLFDPEFKKKL